MIKLFNYALWPSVQSLWLSVKELFTLRFTEKKVNYLITTE
jgi:hypothetical protein